MSHSTGYAKVPSVETVKEWFSTIGYSVETKAKGILRKGFLPPRWRIDIDYARLIWKDIINMLNKKTREKLSLILDFYPCSWNTRWRAFTHVVAELHKEDLQVTSGSTSLGVTGEGGANPQLTISTTKADLGKYDPHDSISKQQGIVKRTKECSFDLIIACVLVDKTKSVSEGLETILNEPEPEKDASNAEREDLSKLVHNVEVDFMDLDSLENDTPIIIQDKDEEEVHAEKTLNSKLMREKDDTETEVLNMRRGMGATKNKGKEVMTLNETKEEESKTALKLKLGHITIIENLYKTKQELEINFNKPLCEHDLLDKLNDLARKKRKHADDIHDYFRSTKKFKSLV
nr:hypothetical protein [Tanacetum cinerariifolium]